MRVQAMKDAILNNDPIWKPWSFDRVRITGKTDRGAIVDFCIMGKCYSEFESGPNLCHVADFAGDLFGAGFYGLADCRALGFRQ